MSETPDANAPAAQHFVEFDEYVDYQIEKARAQIKQNEILTTLAWLGTGFLAYLTAFVIIDQWVVDGGFGYRPRMVMLGIIVTTMLAILSRRVVWPLLKQVHPLYAARVIEKAEPTLKSNLLNYVDLRQAEQAHVAVPVARAIEKRAAVALSHVDVDQTVDRRPLLHVLYLLLALVVFGALYIVLSPKDPFSSVKRALLPAAPIDVATETTISEVTPGDVRVPARSQVVVEADVRGKATDRVQLLFTTTDHKYVDQPVEMRRVDESLPRFRGTLNGENGRGLLQSLTYRIEAGDARTREFNVEVIQPPSVRVESLKYAAPAYTEIPPKEQPGGDIDGWEGTVVTFTATANMPIKSARLLFADSEEVRATGEELTMQIREGTKLSAEWKLALRNDGSFPKFYSIQCKNDNGDSDPEPLRYSIRIRPDQRPEVVLLAPTGDLKKPANAVVPLDIQATDPDFKVRSLWLRAERNGDEIANDQLFLDRETNGALGQSIRGTHEFRLSNLRDRNGDLKPGDVVQYWIEARDNKQPIANRATTPKLKIDIIAPFKTPDEVQKDLAKAKEEQQRQLAMADDAQNPDRAPNEPRDPQSDPNPREGPPPKTPDQAGKTPQEPDEARGQRDREPEPRDDNGGRREPQKPTENDFESALQKFLQRDREQQEQKHPGGKSGDKTDEQSGSDDKQPGDRKPGDKKPGDKSGSGDQRQPGEKSDSASKPKSPSNDKSGGNTDGGKSTGEKDPGEKSAGEKNAGEKSNPDKVPHETEPDPAAGKKSDKPGDKNTKPGDKPDPSQAGKKESGQPDANQKTPGEKTPGDKAATDKGTAGKQAGEKKPGDKSAGDKATGDKSAGEKSGEKAGSEKKPADDAASKPEPGTGDDQRGAPEKSKKPGDDKRPGQTGAGESSKSDDAKQASPKTGNDDGMAEGDPNGDLNSPKSKNQMQKKPGSKQGKTGNTRETDMPPEDSNQQPKPGEGTSSANDDARNAKPAGAGKKESPQPGRVEDPASEKSGEKSQQPSEKRPDDSSDVGNQKPQGSGRKDGQKSEQPQGGEEGSSGASDQGKSGSNKSGAGDKSQQPGNSEKSNEKTGNPGSEKGAGSKSSDSKSGEKAGGESGDGQSKSGSEKSGSEKSGAKSGGKESSSGSPAGKGGDESAAPGQPGQSSGSEGGGVKGQPSSRPGDGNSGPGDKTESSDTESPERGAKGGESDGSTRDERANLEYAKKATNLVLDRLKKQLERGEVDDELLKELGWDKADLERFTNQLEERLKDNGEDNSPEAVARRVQFEETLKSMRLGSGTARRKGSNAGPRTIQQIGTKDRNVPPEYREQWEAYTRSLSKQAPPAKGAAKPAPRTR